MEKQFDVRLSASKAGSQHANYAEKRRYFVVARDVDSAITEAIRLAYVDGLEHVLVTMVDGVYTYGRNV